MKDYLYKADLDPTEIEYEAYDLTCWKCDWEGDLEVLAYMGHDRISFDWACPECGHKSCVEDAK